MKNDFPYFLLPPQLSDKLNLSEDCYFRVGAEKRKGWADGGEGGGDVSGASISTGQLKKISAFIFC